MRLAFRFALLLLILLGSCKKAPNRQCYKKIGDSTSESRLIPVFNRIDLSNRINLIVTPDTLQWLRVEAGENLVSFITTEVIDSVLYITNENNCDFLRSYKSEINVYVGCTDLDVLTFRGEGNITFTDTLFASYFIYEQWGGSGSAFLMLESDEAHINLHTGSGDATVVGKCSEGYFYQRGSGFIDGRKYRTGYMLADQQSTNDMHVNCKALLIAQVAYVGNVYYHSVEPDSIQRFFSSTGKLISSL